MACFGLEAPLWRGGALCAACFTEMPNDEHLCELGCTNRYLPWSEDIPSSCWFTTANVDEEAVLPDEPNVDEMILESLPEGS